MTIASNWNTHPGNTKWQQQRSSLCRFLSSCVTYLA